MANELKPHYLLKSAASALLANSFHLICPNFIFGMPVAFNGGSSAELTQHTKEDTQ